MQNTTLCYLEKDGKYLLLHRIYKKNDVNQGKWIGIGGHFEEGESPYDCAIREVFEETGLALAEARYRGVVTFVSDRYETEQMHLFTSSSFVGEQIACNEGEAAWIKKEDIPSLPLWVGDLIFLELLEQEIPFFSLKLCYTGDALTSAVLDGVPLSVEKYLK
ncbi:MAG: 8-oxo-dGTP diphosphatase [Clostridia bacterium]|nr:8-oxo-dGTP diphosphatase [Clostridia bacterium]